MVLSSVSRVYTYVNSEKPPEYSEYQKNYRLKCIPQDDYELVTKLGRGKYSEVFEAVNVTNNKKRTIKVIKWTKMRRIKREIKILENLRGGENIVKLLGVIRNSKTKLPTLVLEYMDDIPFRELNKRITEQRVRRYLYEVLKALDYSHSMGIMHRDVKPNNIMVDRHTGRLRVIDWGMADFYIPFKEYSTFVSTRPFKGPELVLDYQMYDYSMDMWSLGCVMASMIFRRRPFFRSKDDDDHLRKIVEVLGTDDFYGYVRKYQMELNPKYNELPGNPERTSWQELIGDKNKHLASPEALDLLDKILRYDHNERLTAREAMDHPYFYPLRRHEKTTSTPPSRVEE